MANPQRPQEVLPNPDPSIITMEQIDRSIDHLEEKLSARVDGIEKAIAVFNADLTRVPTLLDRSIVGLRELLETRLVCMENDVKGVHDFLDTRGKEIHEQITHLRELSFSEIGKVSDLTSERITGSTAITNERIKSLSDVTTQQFKSIVDTFAEKDKAVSVGLSAQKESAAAQQASNTEATNKMESNFTKLLDQGRELLAEVRRNTELQINDLKANVNTLAARLDKGEGKTSISDPHTAASMQTVMAEIKALNTYRDTGSGHSAGSAALWGFIVGGLGLLFGLGSFIGLIMRFVK